MRLKSQYSSLLIEEGKGTITPQTPQFKAVENERYSLMRLIFANHNILPSEQAEQKATEIAKTMNTENRKYRDYTASEFIGACYDLIAPLYAGLLRNEFYSETFDLRAYNDILTDPAQLMKLVWSFSIKDNDLTYCSTDVFVDKARIVLGLDKKKIKKYLLFSYNNNDIFPLFLVIRLNKRDTVAILHRFTYFIYAILHASVTKSLFDAQTEQRSLQFERDC